MPRIDPQQLLKTLGILLSPCGGIKSSEEVDRLVKLMSKFSRKLVSKCIYVQILSATEKDLLGHFLTEGGWTLLNSWFDDSIKGQNWPLVKEMCVLFMKCPMTPQLLKENPEENQAPKLINQIRSVPSIRQDIRSLASQLYRSWVEIVSENSKKVAAFEQQPNVLESSGPVSLLQSLADEVAESLEKEEAEKEDASEAAFKSRKVPTVMKPKSNIIDGSIKINKKNLPSNHPLMNKENKKEKSKEKDKEKEKAEKEKEREKRKRQEAAREKERERSKRFRPDHPRDEVNPDEKQRIKDLARKMKEEAAAKKEKEAKKSTTVSSLPPKLPKIPKKPKDDSNKGALSFEDMLGGLDNKPKTVKTPMIKNKNAALLEEMQKKSSTSSSSSSSKSSSSSSSKSSSLKSKDSSSSSSRSDRDRERKSSSEHHHRDRDHHGSKSSSSSSSSSSRNDKKLQLTIPSPEAVSKRSNKEESSPKSANKSPGTNYSESSSFMDALFSSMGVPTRKKKRRLSETKEDNPKTGGSPQDAKKSKSSSNNEESSSPPSASQSGNDEPTPAFSFYKDTLDETKEEAKDGPSTKSESETKDDVSRDDDEKENSVKEEESKENKDDLPFEEPDAMPREVKGILVYHRGREKRDKRIRWRPETNLVEVQYFEVDENERVNVNKIKFENLREFESQMEKAAMKNKGDISDEDTATIPWYKPRPLKVTNREEFTPGTKSTEKDIQLSRERNVLQVIYFSKEMTPDTPKEADPETNTMKVTQPAFIPLDDKEADENSEFHYRKGWPEPKENQVSKQLQVESQFSLPPALSSLLSSMSKDGLDKFLPSMTTISSLSQQEQDTLAAQTQAMKALGILPPTAGNVPNFPPTSGAPGGMPPQMNMNNPPPGQMDFSRFPPPNNGNNGFSGPPPFGGNLPNGPPPPNGQQPPNGFYNQPPPFGGNGNQQHHNNRNNDRNDYHHRGGYNRGGYNNRGGGGHHRNGGYNRDFRYVNFKYF